MTWTKLSDDFSDDCWSLSDAAFRMHVEGLVWSNRKLLDCRISKDDVRRFAKEPGATAELVDAGWWEEDGAHFIIRHHARYQRERAAVLKQQEANRANGAKGGRPPKGPAREIVEDLKKTQSVTQSVTEPLSESGTKRDRTGQDWRSQEAVVSNVEIDSVTGEVLNQQPLTEEQQRQRDYGGVDPWAAAPKAAGHQCSGCGRPINQPHSIDCGFCESCFIARSDEEAA